MRCLAASDGTHSIEAAPKAEGESLGGLPHAPCRPIPRRLFLHEQPGCQVRPGCLHACRPWPRLRVQLGPVRVLLPRPRRDHNPPEEHTNARQSASLEARRSHLYGQRLEPSPPRDRAPGSRAPGSRASLRALLGHPRTAPRAAMARRSREGERQTPLSPEATITLDVHDLPNSDGDGGWSTAFPGSLSVPVILCSMSAALAIRAELHVQDGTDKRHGSRA